MTAVKQKAVCNDAHANNLKNYINNKDALLREFQWIEEPSKWFEEMDTIREIAGHNKPVKEGEENTTMYHQMLNFLPEECSCNGGKMTPEKCMQYAREYAEKRYPQQQIAFALHHEKNKAGERFSVHMAINRTNLETGRRLAEGRAAMAKKARAKTVRALDKEWHLQQLEKGVPNSIIRAQQPRGAEKEILSRGGQSYKHNLRVLCRAAARNATSMEEFTGMLAEWGATVEVKNNKVYVSDPDHAQHRFSVSRLDNTLNTNALRQLFGGKRSDDIKAADANFVKAKAAGVLQEVIKKDYLALVDERFATYMKTVKNMTGSKYANIPELKLPRIPEGLEKDQDILQSTLGKFRAGDSARSKAAIDPPKPKIFNEHSGSKTSTNQQRSSRGYDAPERSNRSQER